MNSLQQHESGCFCSPEAFAALSSLKTSRILVCSDTHGHYDIFEAMIRKFGSSCDALVFAGDGMWDIVQCIENAYESATLRELLPSVIAFVAGNGDGDTYRILIEKFDGGERDASSVGVNVHVPSRQTLSVGSYTLFIAHGHHHSVEVTLEMLVASSHVATAGIAVFGHTHVPFAAYSSDIFVLNPGSPARPRRNSLPSCAILSLDITKNHPLVSFYSIKDRGLGEYLFEEYDIE